jgi:hypothetical protein
MTDPITQALAAAEQIRRSAGYRGLPSAERAALDRDLSRIERALGGRSDPYAVPFETPNDLRGPGGLIPGSGGAPTTSPGSTPSAPPPAQPPAPPRPSGTEALGERARRALDAVDFPSFVAGLIQGTFQAIVDATAHQVREYARLVADLSKTVDQFTHENVDDAQARDWLATRHPRELRVVVPEAGSNQRPHLASRGGDDDAPPWLEDYGLAGASLTDEIVEGPLLQAGRRALGEERMRMLANMVLLGINRIVVDDGQLRARLQFHARAREQVTADISAQTAGQQTGIAARQTDMRAAVSTMVSTVDVNAQADVAIKAELVGEVSIRFRTQAFDLDRFADAQSMAVIRRHAQGTTPTPTATPTPTPTPTPGNGGDA